MFIPRFEMMNLIKYIKFILVIFLLECPYTLSQNSTIDPLSKLLNFINYSYQITSHEPKNTEFLRESYDFIVIGAGTAGCVMANRLSENPDWNVLLIEAGKSENFMYDVPLLTTFIQFTEANWAYRTEPEKRACRGMTGGRCHWPRGKVMGGSSVLNHMIHTRGNRRDYDRWAAAGNPGWSYKDVLPYFKKSERMLIPQFSNDVEYHNTNGYLPVSFPGWKTPLANAFLRAGNEIGFETIDYNGKHQIGFSLVQTNTEDGTRVSSSRAFLHPIRNRPNLDVQKQSFVTRLLINETTSEVYGVEFVRKRQVRQVLASKEVILSAGAINSPQILMVSGIGPKKHLKKLKIKVHSDLQVGYNLQDHIALGGLTFLVNDTVSIVGKRLIDNPDNLFRYMDRHQGPLADPAGSEALAFFNTSDMKDPDGYPNLELLFLAGSFASMESFRKSFAVQDEIFNTVYRPILGRDSYMVFPMLMLPKSRGRIMLRSADPFQKPLIYPNYLSHKDDEKTILEGINLAITLSKTKSFQKYNATLHSIPIPSCSGIKFNTKKYWSCALRMLTQTIYHQSGTCKMGPRESDGVVDARLRVHGIKNLRVVDASIMPHVISGHTNGPTVMIAEKAADMIKEDWEFLD